MFSQLNNSIGYVPSDMAASVGEKDDLANLEAEFQEIINELTDDPNLDKFRLEYEKIHNALKKSNASNLRLQVLYVC